MDNKTKAMILVICQWLSTLGFGVNFILSYIMIKFPVEGREMIKTMMEVPNVPVMQIGFMTMLCAIGMVTTLLANITNLTKGDSSNEEN